MLLKLYVCVQCFRKAVFLQGWLKIFEKTQDNALFWSLQVFFLYNGEKFVSVLQSYPCSMSITPTLQSLWSHTLNRDLVLTVGSSHSIFSEPLGSAEQLHHNAEERKREETFRRQLHWGSSHLHPSQHSSQISLSGVCLVSWPLAPGLHELSKIHLFL